MNVVFQGNSGLALALAYLHVLIHFPCLFFLHYTVLAFCRGYWLDINLTMLVNAV